ncbi:hypothetical protein, partial [Pandoraea sputorum]|uniref:hypothetical protein n=1 Tax=Pandoraea sputorum TaxID=93222 RepID=UPI0035576670
TNDAGCSRNGRVFYLMVNTTLHEWSEKLVEVTVTVQVALPLPIAFLSHFGTVFSLPLNRPPGATLLMYEVLNSQALLPMV